MKVKALVFSIIVVLFSFSCEQDNKDDKGQVTFSFSDISSSNLKSTVETLDASYIMFSVIDDKGNFVCENEIIELIKFGEKYITSPISFTPGSYQLCDFIILDKLKSVVAATPKAGSEYAALVKQALNIDFDVERDKVTNLSPEVISIKKGEEEKFGYATFTLNYVETFEFYFAVFVYNETISDYELTTSEVVLKMDSMQLVNDSVQALTQNVKARMDATLFDFTVTKAGYSIYSQSFPVDTLLKYSNEGSPLIIILEKQKEIIIKGSDLTMKDSHIWNNGPNTNYGSSIGNNAYTWTNGGSLGIKRILMDFDLSSIPADAEIENAFLSIYYNPVDIGESFTTHYGSYDFYIEKITEDWDESTVTWNNQPASIQDGRVGVAASSDLKANFENIDVTSLLTNGELSSNYGFLIRMQNESSYYRAILIASAEHPNVDLRPKLVITLK